MTTSTTTPSQATGRYEVDDLPDGRFALYYVPPIGPRIEHSTYNDQQDALAACRLHAWRLATFILTILQNPYIVQKPHPKQVEFLLLSDIREVLFGGAGGGGKSSALLMAALQYVTEPGYSALILQKTLTNLRKADALIGRAREWLKDNHDAKFADDTWTFPSGARLQFGFVKNDRDKYNFKSAAYQCVCFEEVTEFKEEDYTYLFSRLRRMEGSAIPVRMRGATNPGSVSHQYIKRRFGLDNEGKQSEEVRAAGRVFVQAFASDNPSLDREDYKLSLENLSSRERAYMQYGSWADFTGECFKPYEWLVDPGTWTDLGNSYSLPLSNGKHKIYPKGPDVPVLVTVDWATSEKQKSDCTAMIAAGLLPDGRLLILDVLNAHVRMEHLAATLAAFCRKWNPITVAGENDVLSKAMCHACRQFREIPEIRQLPIRNRDKLMRAQDAINMGENGRIFLPNTERDRIAPTPDPFGRVETYGWLTSFCDQLMSFDGTDKCKDDMVDALSVLASLSRVLRSGGSGQRNADWGVLQLTDPRSEL